MMEKTAPDIVVDASLPEGRNLGSIHPAHDRWIDVHRQPMKRIFRKDDKIHRPHVPPRLAHHLNDAAGLGGQIVGRDHHRQFQLHQTDHHPVGCFVRPPRPFIVRSYFVMESSPGAPEGACVGEDVAISTPRVST